MDGRVVASIGDGFCLLVGIEPDDGEGEVEALVDKVAGLRVFADDTGKMNESIRDVGGQVLVISQFTLLADVRKGRRPSFTGAARPEHAEPLVDQIAVAFEQIGIGAATGAFGASMTVDLVNEGPVTLILEIREGRVS